MDQGKRGEEMGDVRAAPQQEEGADLTEGRDVQDAGGDAGGDPCERRL